MSIFIDLNAKGKTIIIVTHDMGVAEKCGRVVEIFGGVVVKK